MFGPSRCELLSWCAWKCAPWYRFTGRSPMNNDSDACICIDYRHKTRPAPGSYVCTKYYSQHTTPQHLSDLTRSTLFTSPAPRSHSALALCARACWCCVYVVSVLGVRDPSGTGACICIYLLFESLPRHPDFTVPCASGSRCAVASATLRPQRAGLRLKGGWEWEHRTRNTRSSFAPQRPLRGKANSQPAISPITRD